MIINTGGTLSSVAKEYGLTPGLTTESMLRELHIVAGEAILTTLEYASVDSANIFPEDWAKLAQLISEKRDRFDGIVVIHGTDTLAYTGVFVAFNRKVMLGCRASKVRSLSFDAFDSINCANVAEISSIGMKINEQILPGRKGVFRLQNKYCQEVAVLKLFPGMHREILGMYADHGYRAIYIEAFGLGGMPFVKHDFIGEIGRLVEEGMTVLIGTQCRFEGSRLSVYETGRRAVEAGVLQAYDMTTEAAVTKLMWVLGQTDDPDEIREYFQLNLCGEVRI